MLIYFLLLSKLFIIIINLLLKKLFEIKIVWNF